MNQTQIEEISLHLPDTQSTRDTRNVAISKVGVSNVRYPISLRAPVRGNSETIEPQVQHSVATINMSVSLPEHKRGTHMSRFLELLNEYRVELSRESLVDLMSEVRERLQADDAFVDITFPYFITKSAPVTGRVSQFDIDVTLELVSGTVDDFVLTLRLPATSLCPCSKEIAEYGAHNQRCEISVSIRMAEDADLWIEELCAMIERCASIQIYSVLKRPDEKWVTEKAYENPKFVEDIVRDLAVMLRQDERIVWFRCTTENFESIHSHNAFAMVEHDKRV